MNKGGGNSEIGYGVSTDPQRHILRLGMWGMWSQPLAEEYGAAVEAGIRELATLGGFCVLADISRYPPQRPEVQAVHTRCMTLARNSGLRRAAHVVESTLGQMQIKRLAQEMHLPEYAFYQDELSALKWLLSAK